MTADLPSLHLIILAGGKGLRADSGDLPPKQFRTTGRGMMFTVSLRSFLESPVAPATVTVTVPSAWSEEARAGLQPLLDPAGVSWHLAEAGDTRTASTGNAAERLAALDPAPSPDDLVAVHDAARPFADGVLLTRLATSAAQSGGAVPGVPVPDTIVRHDPDEDGGVIYLERSRLLAVQTPQVFRWDVFLEAHRWAAAAGHAFTDDGRLLAERGLAPAVVPGDPGNWKVTSDADWRRAAILLEA